MAATAAAQQLDNYVPTSLPGVDVMPGVTVTSRFRPGYETPQVQVGSVLLTPSVSQSLGYDSNVLGSPNARGSLLLDTQGSLNAATNWPGNTLMLNLNADHYAYPDLPSQSYTNWSVGGGWTYEIGQDTFAVGINHYSLNQLPSGIDSIGLVQPLPYRTDSVRLSYKTLFGSWTFVPLLDFAATRFDKSGASNNQAVTDLDRNVESGAVTAFYEVAPQRSAVFEIRGTTAQYLGGQPRPDYNDVSALGGLDYNATALLHFRILGGYEVRDYNSDRFKNHSAPVVEGTAIWTPTGLTTLTATVTRRIEDANEAVQTGYTFTQARLVVDHEYLRNVLLQGRALVENANYIGGSAQQTLYTAGASVTYYLNRYLRLVGTYDYSTSRTSSGLTTTYDRNVVLIQIRLSV